MISLINPVGKILAVQVGAGKEIEICSQEGEMFFNKNFSNRKTSKGEKGFTLVELIMVMVIIGILATIAIPGLAIHRNKAYNAASHSDLRNMCTAQEAYFVDYQRYAQTILDLVLYGYTKTPGVIPSITAANNTAYSMSTSHLSGDKTWTVSGPGGPIQ